MPTTPKTAAEAGTVVASACPGLVTTRPTSDTSTATTTTTTATGNNLALVAEAPSVELRRRTGCCVLTRLRVAAGPWAGTRGPAAVVWRERGWSNDVVVMSCPCGDGVADGRCQHASFISWLV